MEASDHRRGPDTASMCRDEETPDYNARHGRERVRERGRHGIYFCVYPRERLCRYSAAPLARVTVRVSGLGRGRDTRRDPACHRERCSPWFLSTRGVTLQKCLRTCSAALIVLTASWPRSTFIFRIRGGSSILFTIRLLVIIGESIIFKEIGRS